MSHPELDDILQITEALLIATPEPLTQARFSFSLQRNDIDLAEIVAELQNRFHEQNRPIEIVLVAGGYQLVTRPEYQAYIKHLFRKESRLSLTRAALETLAVVAYRQPVTRTEIDQIRGVNSGSVLHTLLEKELVAIKGRDEGIGRPLLYGTTPAFLQAFGLNRLSDLPKLKEIGEIMGGDEVTTPADYAVE